MQRRAILNLNPKPSPVSPMAMNQGSQFGGLDLQGFLTDYFTAEPSACGPHSAELAAERRGAPAILLVTWRPHNTWSARAAHVHVTLGWTTGGTAVDGARYQQHMPGHSQDSLRMQSK